MYAHPHTHTHTQAQLVSASSRTGWLTQTVGMNFECVQLALGTAAVKDFMWKLQCVFYMCVCVCVCVTPRLCLFMQQEGVSIFLCFVILLTPQIHFSSVLSNGVTTSVTLVRLIFKLPGRLLNTIIHPPSTYRSFFGERPNGATHSVPIISQTQFIRRDAVSNRQILLLTSCNKYFELDPLGPMLRETSVSGCLLRGLLKKNMSPRTEDGPLGFSHRPRMKM